MMTSYERVLATINHEKPDRTPCDTLQPRAWGFKADDDSEHHTPDEVMQMLAGAGAQNCNLLLNTGPLADGSIHPQDVKTLRVVGHRIREMGDAFL